MRFLRRIFRRDPQEDPLDILLERARRTRMLERYDDATAALDDAMAIAQARSDSTTQIAIDLRRGDILIAQERYAEAEQWLSTLRETCETTLHRAPLAYTLSALGQLAQAQGDWEMARNYYTQAREAAHENGADGAAGRAMAHLGDLYLHEGNASYALHLLNEAVPRLERSGDLELLGYFMGRTGQAMLAMGQRRDGLREMERGLDTAVRLQNRAHTRLLSRLLGEQAAYDSDYLTAKRYYENALDLFPASSLPSATHTHLQIALSQVLSQLSDASAALEHAQAAAEHAAQFGLQALVELALGQAHLAHGDPEIALEHLQQAKGATDGLTVSNRIELLRTLGQLTEQTDATQAVSYYQQALDLSDDPAQSATLHSDLATLHSKLGDDEAARAAWKAAKDAYGRSATPEKAALVDCALGAIAMRAGEGRRAKRHFTNGLEQLNSIHDTVLRGDLLAAVAIAYSDLGPVDSALDFFTEAVEIARRADNPQAEATRRSYYGRLSALTGDPKRAITEIMQARNISTERGDALAVAQQTNHLGLAYAALNDYTKAIDLHREAVEAFEQLGDVDGHQLAGVYLGEAYQQLGEGLKAETEYTTVLQTGGSKRNLLAQIRALIGLAEIDETNGLENLQQAQALAERAQFKRELARIETARSRLLAARGESDAARAAWEKAIKLRNSMQMPVIETKWLE